MLSLYEDEGSDLSRLPAATEHAQSLAVHPGSIAIEEAEASDADDVFSSSPAAPMHCPDTDHVYEWSQDDVAEWLSYHRLVAVAQCMHQNGIAGVF